MYILFSMCKQRSMYCFDTITMYYVYRRSFVLALVLLGNPNKYVYTKLAIEKGRHNAINLENRLNVVIVYGYVL